MHQRVQRISPDGYGRRGLVVSQVHVADGAAIVDVIPENCASGRPEPWRLVDIQPLPRRQQLPALGGKFRPAKGYPMISPPSH